MVSVVVKVAIISRAFAWIIQVIFNGLITDHNAAAFRLKPLKNPTEGDRVIHHLFEGFSKWDGSYFLTISEDGYTQPQMFVFFPLFPAIVRTVALVIHFPFSTVISFRSSLMISSFVTNTFLFVLSASLLQKLAERLLKDANMATAAAVLFCFNPGSVFMSATYSESLFSFLTFLGMLAYQDKRLITGAVLFGLSSATRSNGIVSFGFLIYHWIQQLTRDTLIAVSAGKTNVCLYIALLSLEIAIFLTGLAALNFGPFLLFQMYSYSQVCHSQRFTFPATIFEYILPVNSQVNYIPSSTPPAWCQKSLPLPYSNIQAEVWEVGFFNYFQLRKIPNFFLALPVIVLSVRAITTYCKQNWEYVRWMGLLPPRKLGTNMPRVRDILTKRTFYILLICLSCCCLASSSCILRCSHVSCSHRAQSFLYLRPIL
ncbi:hypothetical protein BSL78_11106 [Apostichopus japonicus]|uniref:GPI mannosyltransferase 2 n=1 Tax=Stichopus japonicus TaxID=307972 RepID=A0A2G8KVJ4_STIJA|nr:hypothetical protein BSL78_11106 [Apostichopus japonicus]